MGMRSFLIRDILAGCQQHSDPEDTDDEMIEVDDDKVDLDEPLDLQRQQQQQQQQHQQQHCHLLINHYNKQQQQQHNNLQNDSSSSSSSITTTTATTTNNSTNTTNTNNNGNNNNNNNNNSNNNNNNNNLPAALFQQLNSPLDALFQMTSSTFDALKRGEKRKDRDTTHHGSANFANKQTSKKKRKSRTAFTNNQIYELERRFRQQKYLSPTDRDEIAMTLNLSNAQVITWFQNRRAKMKRDLEEQKRDIETATLLNLHKTILESFQANLLSHMKSED